MIDRQDSEQKYSPAIWAAMAAFSIRRRITYSSRSNLTWSMSFSQRIRICSISGRVALAFSPRTPVFTGTWRQP